MTVIEAKVGLDIREKDSSKLKKIILVLVLLVVAGGAGYIYIDQICQKNIEQEEQ
jgi:hypothetical protein